MILSGSNRLAVWVHALVLGASAALTTTALAQTPTAPEAVLPATAQAPADAGVRFSVVVTAPAEQKNLLERHLDILRFRDLPDLDATELRRLANQIPDNVRNLLGTQGHFSPEVAVSVIPTPATSEVKAEAATAGWTVSVKVQPGPLSTVETVLLAFKDSPAPTPPAASASTDPLNTPASQPSLQSLQDRIKAQWLLPVGRGFSQGAWSEAKGQALRTLTADRYPAARLAGSLADVDAETHQVHLAVEMETGPAYTLGDIQIEGLERYEGLWFERLVKLSGAQPGSPYQLSRLQAAQQRLAQSGYFDSVFVYVDPADDPQAAPVRVQVREARLGRLVLGVGGSTDNGARISAEHTWNRVPGLDWRALSKLKLEQDNRLGQTDLRSPVDDEGWQWNTGIKGDRLTTTGLTTTSQQVRAGKLQEGDDLNRSYYLQYDRAQSHTATGSTPANQSISANYAWSRARFDNMPLPNRGSGLAAEVGVGWTLAQEKKPFVRTKVRWLGLWPLDQLASSPLLPRAAAAVTAPVRETPRWGRLSLRLEGGAIASQTTTALPESQRFFTGGDQTVRGYGLREIGVADATGTLSPGKFMTVASLEWQRPILKDGQVSPWESTLFVDSGAVANSPAALQAKIAVGAGARYNSPVGPLQVDLAYGLSTKRFRLHLSVGFTF